MIRAWERRPTASTGEGEETRGPRRRTRASRAEGIGLGAIIAVAALLVIFAADAAPTGHDIIDATYRVLVVAATVLAAARARRWNLLVAAALVSVGSDGWMLVPAAAALALGFVMAWRNRRERLLGGVAGALVAWAALRLSWPASPTGATALLAAAALVPLWVSGYRNARRPTRRALAAVGAIALAIAVIGTGLAAAFALTQRSTLVTAADSTVDAASSITSSDGSASRATFKENEEAFRTVADRAGAWWMFPSRVVPVVAQHVTAVEVAARSGADLTSFAGELAGSVDYDRLQRPDGSIDLALLSQFSEPVQRADRTVRTVADELRNSDSPWLIPPLADQLDEFSAQVDEAGTATVVADAAVRHLPALLGGDAPRRYLLLLGNPSEARDLGGHLGNWADLVVTDGKIDVGRVGTPYELFGPTTEPEPTLTAPGLPPSLVEMQPTRFPQNWGATHDLATVASVATELYPQAAGGAPIDGVIYADPIAFAALLRLTGPVEAGGVRLDAENAVTYLTRDQFLAPDPQAAPVSDLIRAALDRLTDNQLPSTESLTEAFSTPVRRGHLQFRSNVTDENELMDLVGLDQELPEPDGDDVVAVVTRNANPSKIDSYLRRTVDYRVDWDPATGEVRARVVATLSNEAPATGLPPLIGGGELPLPLGTNRTQLSVLSPFDVVGAMVDGRTVGTSSRSDLPGMRRHTVALELPPSTERTVVVDLIGTVDPGRTYHLTWLRQPLLTPDRAQLVIEADGARFVGGAAEGRVELDDGRVTDLRVRVAG